MAVSYGSPYIAACKGEGVVCSGVGECCGGMACMDHGFAWGCEKADSTNVQQSVS